MPLDTLTAVHPLTALDNVAALHHLPQVSPADVRVTRLDGHTVIHVALTEATAEPWRAALALPPNVATENLHYTSHRATGLWMGAEVRLHYATA